MSGPVFTVQLGTGKGTFNPVATTISAPASFVLSGTTVTGADKAAPDSFAVGDINGDGKADLVFLDNGLTAGNTTYPTPVYFTALSNGDGTFAAPTPHALPQIAPAADFDISNTASGVQIINLSKGGNAGLIVAFNEIEGGTGVTNPYNEGFAVLPGNGDGTFKSPIITSTYSSATAPYQCLPTDDHGYRRRQWRRQCRSARQHPRNDRRQLPASKPVRPFPRQW